MQSIFDELPSKLSLQELLLTRELAVEDFVVSEAGNGMSVEIVRMRGRARAVSIDLEVVEEVDVCLLLLKPGEVPGGVRVPRLEPRPIDVHLERTKGLNTDMLQYALGKGMEGIKHGARAHRVIEGAHKVAVYSRHTEALDERVDRMLEHLCDDALAQRRLHDHALRRRGERDASAVGKQEAGIFGEAGRIFRHRRTITRAARARPTVAAVGAVVASGDRRTVRPVVTRAVVGEDGADRVDDAVTKTLAGASCR